MSILNLKQRTWDSILRKRKDQGDMGYSDLIDGGMLIERNLLKVHPDDIEPEYVVVSSNVRAGEHINPESTVTFKVEYYDDFTARLVKTQEYIAEAKWISPEADRHTDEG